ncbi:MAG: hypothetical protein KDA57_11380 [Planctomycetales bacterium]|nr:hypothetical protein [Planctomycetales bacterium]
MRFTPRFAGLVAAVAVAIWGVQGNAADWYDDFSDGNTNSPPVTWTHNPVGAFPGSYDASSGDFILGPTNAGNDDENLISTVNGHTFTDTSVRTLAAVGTGTIADPNNNADFDSSGIVTGFDFLTWQNGYGTAGLQSEGNANFTGLIDNSDLNVFEDQFGGPPNFKGGNVGVMSRFDPSTGNGYLVVIDDGNQFNLLAIEGWGGVQAKLNDGPGEDDLPIDPMTGYRINANSDVWVQLDITGAGSNTLLEVWFWKPGEPMPATPFFSYLDVDNGVGGIALINSGSAGIIYNEDEGNSPGIFREVQASSTHLTDPLLPLSASSAPVPEPTSGVLAVLSALALGSMRRRRVA